MSDKPKINSLHEVKTEQDMINYYSETFNKSHTDEKVAREMPNLVEHVIKNYKMSPVLNFFIGTYYHSIGSFHQSEPYYKRALVLNKAFTEPCFSLMHLYMMSGMLKKGEKFLTDMCSSKKIIHLNMAQKLKMAVIYLQELEKHNDYDKCGKITSIYSSSGEKYLEQKMVRYSFEKNEQKEDIMEYLEIMYIMTGKIYNDIDITKSLGYYFKGISLYERYGKYFNKNTNQIITDILKSIICGMEYTTYQDISKIYEYQRKLTEMKGLVPVPRFSHNKIRVAYLTPDLNKNAVALFSGPLIKNYDKDKFELYVFYTRKEKDIYTETFSKYVKNWIDTSTMLDENMRQIIVANEIDILIDLLCQGHGGSKVNVVQSKPCNKIVNYLGFPNTSGIKEYTHRICDDITDPLDTKQFYTEKLVRLNGCFICYSLFENEKLPDIISVERNKINIGVLNKVSKQNSDFREVLMRIVKQNKNHVLHIKMDKPHCEVLYKDFPKDQIKFLGFQEKLEDYFKSFYNLDFCVDTFPYSGTTTTCSSLLMGIPTFTISGKEHRQNVSSSIIHYAVPSDRKYICSDVKDMMTKIRDFEPETLEQKQQRRDEFLKYMNPDRFMKEDYEPALLQIYEPSNINDVD